MKENDNGEFPKGKIVVYNYPDEKPHRVHREFPKKGAILVAIGLSVILTWGVAKKIITARNEKIQERLDNSVVMTVTDKDANLKDYYGENEEEVFDSFWAYKSYVKNHNSDYGIPNNGGVEIPNIIDPNNPLFLEIENINNILETTKFENESYKTTPGQSIRQVAEDVLPYPIDEIKDADPVTERRIRDYMNGLYDRFTQEMLKLNGLSSGDFLPSGTIIIPSSKEYALEVQKAVDLAFLLSPDDGLDYYSERENDYSGGLNM